MKLPDGSWVRAAGIAARRTDDAWRDYGIYLDDAWAPTWPAIVVEWPDYGVPALFEDAYDAINGAYERARSGGHVEVGCLGGLGRTGTVLSCFVVRCGCSAPDAIAWVRSNYDSRAIETVEQEQWVDRFAQRWTCENGMKNEQPADC